MKTIKHNGHEHLLRTVNENVLGLLIDDRETDTISGAFAWDGKRFDQICKVLTSYWKFQLAAEELDDDLPRTTKISTLADFLKSNNFKRLGIKIDSPNDYFMLGYSYCAVLSMEKDRLQRDMPAGMGGMMGLSPQDVITALKQLKRIIEERGNS